jgi:putative peptidoglycan lipid II flippase
MQHKNTSSNQQDAPSKSTGVLRNALLMAAGTMSSRVLGLIRDVLFAALFPKMVTDAWTVAFKLPNFFRRLLGEGSLGVSLIPVFVECQVNDPSAVRAKNLVNSFYSFLLVILTVVTTLGVLFAEPLILLITDPAYAAIPGKLELTVMMAQIMFCFIFLISTFAFLMGIHNALGSFAWPGFAPALWNIAMIVGILWPAQWQSQPGVAAAWSVVIGGALQVVVLIPGLYRRGFLPRWSFHWFNSDVARVWLRMLPGMAGLAVLQVTTLLNTYFASKLGEGSNTYFFYADRLLELPLSLVSVSLGTALLPLLSGYWAKGEKEQLIETSLKYFKLNLFIGVAAALGLFVLSEPLVQMFFERGRFTAEDTLVTSQILQVSAFTLIVSSGVRVLVPSFNAIGSTWFPAAVSAVCVVFHASVAGFFLNLYQAQGLALATVLSAALNLTLLFFGFSYFIGRFPVLSLAKSMLLFLLPASAMSGFLFVFSSQQKNFEQVAFLVVEPILPWLTQFPTLWRVAYLLPVIGLAALIYFGVGLLMNLPEAKESFGTFVQKVKGRFQRK